MNNIFLGAFLLTFWAACQTPAAKQENTTAASVTTDALALPFQASYSTQWTQDVSDQDLQVVLQSYKYWQDGDIKALVSLHADTVLTNPSSGGTFTRTKAELLDYWQKTRDSLSQVTIQMTSWHKMYAADKKEAFVVTWYKETDVYKDGKVDSAEYHDISGIKNAKLTWYSSYRRPL